MVIKVKLSAKKPGFPDREFRFILDTGATRNVLDVSVPNEYYWDEPDKPKIRSSSVKDATGVNVATKPVSLKRLELAGMVRDDQMAYRMDLKGTALGQNQDHPVDGILGMNFLRGTRFVIEPRSQEIKWWKSIPGHLVRVGYTETDLPTIPVKLSGSEVAFVLDTGANGGFEVSGELDAKDAFELVHRTGSSGTTTEVKRVKVDRLEADGKAWLNIYLDLMKPGEGSPSVGRDVLCAAPLGLDFIDGWATFQPDSQGNLPFRQESSLGLDLIWGRSQNDDTLRVGTLPLGSGMKKAGFKQNDIVLRVGSLAGKALTRRSIQTIVAQGKVLQWLVQREGKEVALYFPKGSTNTSAH